MLADSHCHLPSKVEKAKDIVKRANENGVALLVNIGTDLQDSKKAQKGAQEINNVYCSVGIYPHSHRGEDIDSVIKNLTKLVELPKVVGIGECGIDITNWENQRPLEEQITLFEKQIQLAIEVSKPIIIHNRNGDTQVIELLQKYQNQDLKIIAHCFDSTIQTAQRLLDMGAYISFSGMITFNSKKDLKEVVKVVPLDKILLETDSPYLVPKGVKEKTNEPKNVKMVAHSVAELKQISPEEVENTTFHNTTEIFGIEI